MHSIDAWKSFDYCNLYVTFDPWFFPLSFCYFPTPSSWPISLTKHSDRTRSDRFPVITRRTAAVSAAMTTTKTTRNVSGKTKMIPPDGGWGWVVLTSALTVNFLIPGTVKSFGVLFVEFLHVFKASPTAASWMPALCYFLYNSLGKEIRLLTILSLC